MDLKWIAALSALLALAASTTSADERDMFDSLGPSDLSRSAISESCRQHEDGSDIHTNLQKRAFGLLLGGLGRLGRFGKLGGAGRIAPTLGRSKSLPTALNPLAAAPKLGRTFSLPAAGKAPILSAGKGIPSTAGLVADDVAKAMAKNGRVVQNVVKDSSGAVTSITYAKPGKVGMLVKFGAGAAVGVGSMVLVNSLLPIKPPNLFEGEPEVVQFQTPEELAAAGSADPNAAADPNASPVPEAPAPSPATSAPAAAAFSDPAFNDATGFFYCAKDNSACFRLDNDTSTWDANCLDNADGKYRECNPARASGGTCLSNPQLDEPSQSWFCLADQDDNINVFDRFRGVWVSYCPSGNNLVPCSDLSGTPDPAATANAAPAAAEAAPPAAAAADTTPPAAAAADTTPPAPDAATAAGTTPQAPDAAAAA